MNSRATPRFWRCFDLLPPDVQRQARIAYQRWQDNPDHPGLDFKQIGRTRPMYSVRIGIHWRALGLRTDDGMLWVWIGSHAEYDRLTRQI